jgi:phosphoserine phosphatase
MIIYNTSEKHVKEKMVNCKGVLCDLDGTLINITKNKPSKKGGYNWTWNAMEESAGLHENKEHERLNALWWRLSKKRDKNEKQEKELVRIQDALNEFWIGKSWEEVTRDLYPIPFMEGVEHFFEKVSNYNSKHDDKFILGITTTAPHLYASDIGKRLNISYIDGDLIEIKDGKFTGKIGSDGLYGKKTKFLRFCCRNDLCLGQVIYHEDNSPGIEVFNLCGVSVAVRPFGGIKGKKARVANSADVVLVDGNWYEHPLLDILKNK